MTPELTLYGLATRLDLLTLIDRHVPKRGCGPSVGTYLLVAILNRCVAPCSKASIPEWFQDTVLRRLIPIEPRQLSSQRFRDNMDRIPRETIAVIERELVIRMVKAFSIDLSQVLFDATNFFTFIDTFNEKNTLAQRGKSKEGRQALRVVGLALLVSADGHVPLLHRTYPGNRADAPTFRSLTDALIARCHELTNGAEHVTLVFDKGNNAADNLAGMADSPYHFIGSLVPTHHPDLLAIPKSRFRPLNKDGLPGVSAWRTTRVVFGVPRTVLVTYNENLFVAQLRILLREIAERQQRLRELVHQLARWQRGELTRGKPPSALMPCSLLRREIKRHGIDLSILTLLDQLGKIREVGLLYPDKDKGRKPTPKTTLSQTAKQQRALFDAFNLGRYLAA